MSEEKLQFSDKFTIVDITDSLVASDETSGYSHFRIPAGFSPSHFEAQSVILANDPVTEARIFWPRLRITNWFNNIASHVPLTAVFTKDGKVYAAYRLLYEKFKHNISTDEPVEYMYVVATPYFKDYFKDPAVSAADKTIATCSLRNLRELNSNTSIKTTASCLGWFQRDPTTNLPVAVVPASARYATSSFSYNQYESRTVTLTQWAFEHHIGTESLSRFPEGIAIDRPDGGHAQIFYTQISPSYYDRECVNKVFDSLAACPTVTEEQLNAEYMPYSQAWFSKRNFGTHKGNQVCFDYANTPLHAPYDSVFYYENSDKTKFCRVIYTSKTSNNVLSPLYSWCTNRIEVAYGDLSPFKIRSVTQVATVAGDAISSHGYYHYRMPQTASRYITRNNLKLSDNYPAELPDGPLPHSMYPCTQYKVKSLLATAKKRKKPQPLADRIAHYQLTAPRLFSH